MEFSCYSLPTDETYSSLDEVPASILQPLAIYDAINGRDHGIHSVDRVHQLLDEFVDQQCFVVDEHEESVATLLAVANYRRESQRAMAWIEGLAVHPSARGRGVGGFALEQLIAVAQSDNLQTIKLESTPNAVNFYTHHGFDVDEYRNHRPGPVMSRRL